MRFCIRAIVSLTFSPMSIFSICICIDFSSSARVMSGTGISLTPDPCTLADDLDDGLAVNRDRAHGVVDEQPLLHDERAFAPVVLDGFLHVGEAGLGRQPADAFGVEQAGLDLRKHLVGSQ